jgi:plastocyanin
MKKSLVTGLACVAGGGLFASTVASGATTIRVRDNVFSPKSASVKTGSTVTFRWAGDNPHNVKVTSGPVRFTSKTQTSGTYKRKLSRKGTYRFVCTIHPGMSGKVSAR